MYVGKTFFLKLVQMLPFINMLFLFISIKCYNFFQSLLHVFSKRNNSMYK